MIDFQSEVMARKDSLIERRRDLHQHPELAFQEVRTAGIVAQTLTDLGMEVQTGVGKTGVVGILEGDTDGPTLLVRADMDALPILEANQVDYVSGNEGVMHACGHDGHTSIGLTVAEIMTAHRDQIHGRIKFVFQPAEEIGQGAKAMVDDGVLTQLPPDYSIGLHLWNDMPVGEVSVTPGPCLSAADLYSVKITGQGGHAASPYQTHDPVVAAAQIITALQSIPSRNVNALDSAVISVTAMQAGEAYNVIPDEVNLKGTIRTYRKETQQLVHRRFHEIIEGIAQSMGCIAEIEVMKMTPAVNNDPTLSAQIKAIVGHRIGADKVHDDVRTMGSEDMSYLMDDIPGCFFFVGSANAERGLNYPHHNPRFDIDEESLVIGATLLAEAAASFVMPDTKS